MLITGCEVETALVISCAFLLACVLYIYKCVEFTRQTPQGPPREFVGPGANLPYMGPHDFIIFKLDPTRP
jgi:hypothetical protein